MDVSVTAEEIVDAFQRDWPHQYEITCLRLVVTAQGKQLADLRASTQSAGDQEV